MNTEDLTTHPAAGLIAKIQNDALEMMFKDIGELTGKNPIANAPSDEAREEVFAACRERLRVMQLQTMTVLVSYKDPGFIGNGDNVPDAKEKIRQRGKTVRRRLRADGHMDDGEEDSVDVIDTIVASTETMEKDGFVSDGGGGGSSFGGSDD